MPGVEACPATPEGSYSHPDPSAADGATRRGRRIRGESACRPWSWVSGTCAAGRRGLARTWAKDPRMPGRKALLARRSLVDGGEWKEAVMKASEIMSRPVSRVRPEEDLRDAAVLMADRGFAALPVVDEDGQVVGMLSESDVLRHAADMSDRAVAQAMTTSVTGRPPGRTVRNRVGPTRSTTPCTVVMGPVWRFAGTFCVGHATFSAPGPSSWVRSLGRLEVG
ncbi:HPP family protein [Kibdelosporangium lantanae]|uniref:HPP family protein n=1 Tax=Kibdelosporangium lantanae TaxID=1497396 RepID=A0ABW3MF00_9PSEU